MEQFKGRLRVSQGQCRVDADILLALYGAEKPVFAVLHFLEVRDYRDGDSIDVIGIFGYVGDLRVFYFSAIRRMLRDSEGSYRYQQQQQSRVQLVQRLGGLRHASSCASCPF